MLKAILTPYLGWIYGAALIAVLAGGVWAYNSIYDRGYEAAVIVKEQEAASLKAANDLAIAKAKESLEAGLATLKQEKERLENDVARLNAEAAEDPDAAVGGISAGSVQRLNSIR